MATVTDITTTPTSGLNHIDALLDTGPDWNYLTPAGNTLYYTFSIASGNESGQSGQAAFTLSQQASTRSALDYISKLTGIQFKEVVNGTDAQIHLCNLDLQGSNVTGLCSWHSSYSYSGTDLVSYEADAYVYLDNVEWFAQNHNLTPGTYGYETLLHELGHALGLKHPFDDSIHLPPSQDNTSYTLMSYTNVGGAHAAYSQYDIAALNWLYGGDGLGGALGINSTTGARYITGTNGADTLTGTAANDKLEGDGGNDMIDGGNGFDTAVFRGVRSSYAFSTLSNGDLSVASLNGIDGTDTLHSVELLQFSDMSVSRADIVDTTAPAAPTMVVTKNVNQYATGNTPLVTVKAEPGAVIKVYLVGSNQQVGLANDSDDNKIDGLYTFKLNQFANGTDYKVYATATDAAGNVSKASETISFKVDATAPVIPAYDANLRFSQNGNQVTFNGGTGEAGSTIELVRAGDLQTIARTTVGSDGKWQIETSPLLNGNYTISVVSLDQADNGTSAASRATFTVNSAANFIGTNGNDTFRPNGENNALDGGAGSDTVIYSGPRSNFTVHQEAWGFGVTDNIGNNGHDALINIETVKFDDAWLSLDIDGVPGQIDRLYTAVLGRTAEAAGMGYWMWRMEKGTPIQTVAGEFMKQAEFDTLYGQNPSDATFVTKLYDNVLHRAPEAAGYEYWMGVLANSTPDTKVAVRTQMLINFAESLENQVNVVGKLQLGIDYVPWQQA
jgi:serralysin